MQAVAALLMSVALITPAEAPVFNAPVARVLPPAGGRAENGGLMFAQGPLPTIDRQLPAHDLASATRTNGHFFFETEVNGVAVVMMFDTGATTVTLRAEDAARAGIDTATLQYTVKLTTANGFAVVAPAIIKSMKVGNITRLNIPAVVAKPGTLAFNLLGQSFMSTVAGFTTEGDRLVLRGD